MALSSPQRWSRTSIFLCILGSFLLIQLVFRPIKSVQRPTALSWSGYTHHSSLKSILVAEEAQYSIALQDREALVKKLGPKPEDVQAFPHGPLYTVWNFFPPTFNCPHRVERIGTLDDGGKWMCGLQRVVEQRKPCIMYTFGINGESSFEEAVMKAAPHCEVWGYDFSVNSFGPEIENNPALKSRAHFFPYKLGGADMPHTNPPMFTLQTLMEHNGHDFIDILKVDVEGAEFDALSSFVNHFVPPGSNAQLPIGQLELEIHLMGEYTAFSTFKSWWENLERVGLRPFFMEPNLVYLVLVKGALPTLSEYSFINVNGRHAITDDTF